MRGGEDNESGFRWSLQEEENWFQLPQLKKRRSLCICNRLSDNHLEHGKLTVTLKALRQSSLLGCTTCRGLLAGIRGILDTPHRKERRDSMEVDVSREHTIQDRERHIDELVLSYQVDPNFECPLSPGGWNLRCGCNYPCPHQKYYLDFEIITPHGTLLKFEANCVRSAEKTCRLSNYHWRVSIKTCIFDPQPKYRLGYHVGLHFKTFSTL